MKTTTAIVVAMVTIFSLNANAQGFFSNFNAPDLPGERRAVIDIELRGLAMSTYTVRCFYSTDSMKVVRALSNLAQPGDVSIATAKRDALGTDKMRCSIIFPHSKHPTPNSSDVRPAQIGAPNRVFCAWVRSHSIQGAREQVSVTSAVSGFKMPRLLVISYSGDSYASGEGAPNSNDANNRWDMEDGANGDCHRSEKSGGVRAIKKLRNEHPEWAIKYVNVTCSGALLQDFYDFRTRGTNGTLRPQLEQIKDKIGSRSTVDIFLSDGGGNDVVLVDIGTNALTDVFGDICDDAGMQRSLNDAISNVPDRYQFIADILKSGRNPLTNRDIGYKVGKVVWFNYPSPLTDKTGKLCSPSTYDFKPDNSKPKNALDAVGQVIGNATGTIGNTVSQAVDCWGPLEKQISDCDWRWLRDNIFPKINGAIANASRENQWDLVDVSGRAIRHGMCNCEEPYFNTLGQSLGTQGDHRGTMHPNSTGFSEIYVEPIAEQLEKSIMTYHNELKSAISNTAIQNLLNNQVALATSRLQTGMAKIKAQRPISFKKNTVRQKQIDDVKKTVKPTRPNLKPQDLEPVRKEADTDNND